MTINGSLCVVTGATEGIGRAIAGALGERGARLALCARTAERVQHNCRRSQITRCGCVGRRVRRERRDQCDRLCRPGGQNLRAGAGPDQQRRCRPLGAIHRADDPTDRRDPRGERQGVKHAVLGFSRSLMLEVRKSNIRVIAVCPGSVETSFFDKAGVELTNADKVLQPEDVAESVVAALALPPRALVSELDIRPTNP
ncbi:MAG: SDR family NAD(P)-dependent oxidoreductase [Gemmatimonadetes bacterium]|nr:MAG: SDR family NAD(P)-dependent oxidoreductase [Gemmatimonadota bacterium]